MDIYLDRQKHPSYTPTWQKQYLIKIKIKQIIGENRFFSFREEGLIS